MAPEEPSASQPADPEPQVPAPQVPAVDFSGDPVAEHVVSAPTAGYDPREDREKARRNVAYSLIALLAAEAVGASAALAAGVDLGAIRGLLEIIFAPTATLAGTVTAFYFAVERDQPR